MVEFGNQRIAFNEKIVNLAFSRADPKIDEIVLSPDSLGEPSASKFYRHIGVRNYQCIDLNNKDGAHIYDLNMNLRDEYGFTEKFDLVVNNGTSEHIFDQKQVFTNLHNLTKVGGVILNVVPFSLWINHGFYNYNPITFRDLAYANEYKWNFLWLGSSSGKFKTFDPNGMVNYETKRVKPFSFIERYHPRRPKKYSLIEKYFNSAIEDNGQIQIVSAFQKTSDRNFVNPLQGKWIHNVDKLNATEKILNYLKQPDTFQKFNS